MPFHAQVSCRLPPRDPFGDAPSANVLGFGDMSDRPDHMFVINRIL